MKKYIIAILISCGMGASAQEITNIHFSSPLDIPLVLSGNFGEIRANHFHGGLDFKTQGAPGKKIHAMDDGYISNIRVTHGSGYVLDVTYDNGYMTTLRHNQGYVGEIARRVKELQYANESWEVEIVPEKDEYRVKAGQHIAWSGNMGYSFGPHLHMDMFEVSSGDFIDPLPFFRSRIKDNKAPKALGFMLFPQTGKGVVNGNQGKCHFAVGSKNDIITAWGEIGSGIKAYDYLDAANNRCGVHTVSLLVDDVEVFRSVVDRFSQEENRMINSWAYGQYMKSFIEPGNRLRLLQAMNDNRGLVTIDEERDYRFTYVLKDVYGNTSRYSFTVRGKNQKIPKPDYREKYHMKWNRVNLLKEPGLDLYIPRGQLYDDVALNYSASADTNAFAYTYRLHSERVALHQSAVLQIGLIYRPIEDMTKYYIARINDKRKLISIGGKYENGFIKANIRELGTYTVAIDTVPPKVTPINKANWVRNERIVYKIEEEETDIQSYRVTIDGNYALFALHIMNNNLVYELDPKRLKRGTEHTVEVTVTDTCGNTTVVSDTFTWK